LFIIGIAVYATGAILLAVSLMNFAVPSEVGINKNGLYRLSRNPIYMADFVFFVGCVLLTQSLLLLIFVLVLQIATYWIIVAEERWCIETFGDEYLKYMNSVSGMVCSRVRPVYNFILMLVLRLLVRSGFALQLSVMCATIKQIVHYIRISKWPNGKFIYTL